MSARIKTLNNLVEHAQGFDPIRVAVVDAAQGLVIQALREAHALGIIEPRLIGNRQAIEATCDSLGWEPDNGWIIPAANDAAAAAMAVELIGEGRADAVMKGNIHTDVLMRALLDKKDGLRQSGRRVSHVFIAEMPSHPKLLGITDAAINIAPDLNAKAQIMQNAVELFHLLGVKIPKVAVISAVETVNPAIASTLDAACLTLMARRGQIGTAFVDGPLAFDNAISTSAAEEKGIKSDVAGDADVVLVPDLVSGNILAKNLAYLAGAVAAGVVVGLTAPVVLTSRADPPAARLAGLALASRMHHQNRKSSPAGKPSSELLFQCVPQPERACCPISG